MCTETLKLSHKDIRESLNILSGKPGQGKASLLSLDKHDHDFTADAVKQFLLSTIWMYP